MALKLLHTGLVQDEYFRVNFRRELKELRRQHHPHVLTFLGAGEWDDGRLYLATEYCDRGGLDTLLADEGVAMDLALVLRLGSEIAEVRCWKGDPGKGHWRKRERLGWWKEMATRDRSE